MSRWGCNATWQRQGAWFLREKGPKTGSHVTLEGSDVALGVQRDVAGTASLIFVQKRGQKWEPRRIGVERCRVGSPTRRGWSRKPDFRAEKGPKAGATSHWRGVMSRWGSNATWQRQGAWFSGGKVVKSARHVVLEGSEVVLGVQRDVAAGDRPISTQKDRAPIQTCVIMKV